MEQSTKKRKPQPDKEKQKKVRFNAKASAKDEDEEVDEVDYNYTGDDEVQSELANEDYHGNKIEPFNMKQELDEGHFDEKTGSYIENKKGNAARDAWLDDYDELSNVSLDHYENCTFGSMVPVFRRSFMM